MTTTTFLIDLGLPDIKVLDVKTDQQGDYRITIRSTETEGCCRVCGAAITRAHGYDGSATVRHLPILGRKCYLQIQLPRFRCDVCPKKPTTTLQPCWRRRNSGYTLDFEEYLLTLLMNSTISDVSLREGIGEGVIERLLSVHVETTIDWATVSAIGQLGVDEITLKKGHKDFVTIITSRIKGEIRLLAVLKDRRKQTLIDFFKTIPKALRTTLACVCSDFYEGFINAAKQVFGKRVRIVIDRFHLAKLYRKGLDTLRKQVMGQLKKTLSKADYANLRGAMWALRKSGPDQSEKERQVLSLLFKHSSSLQNAYRLSDQLTQLLNTQTSRNGGIRRLKNWMSKVRASDVSCFDTFMGTLTKWLPEVANYFVQRENSGFVEGFNNRIKVLKRRCYGIVDRNHLYQRISLDLGMWQLAS